MKNNTNTKKKITKLAYVPPVVKVYEVNNEILASSDPNGDAESYFPEEGTWD